jgi:DNA repair protein RadC
MEVIQPAVAEIAVSYINKVKAKDRPQITSSIDAHMVLSNGFNPDTIALQEQFVVAYLNRANQVIGLYRMATGGQTGVVADPRMVIVVALKIAATGFVCAHNHPSGSLRPSRADEELTHKLKEASRLLDLKLLDHLILSPCGDYYSFADEGVL